MLLLFLLLLLLVCSISPEGLKTTCQRWRFDQQQFTILYHCTHAHALTLDVQHLPRRNKERKRERERERGGNIQSNNLLISTGDRRVIHDDHAVSVYLFFISTEEIIIKKKKNKKKIKKQKKDAEDEQQRLQIKKRPARTIVKKSS